MMTPETILENLDRTIAGKEELVEDLVTISQHDEGVVALLMTFLETNLSELRAIRADVAELVRRDSDKSWEGQVDRQSGAFDPEEIANSKAWR